MNPGRKVRPKLWHLGTLVAALAIFFIASSRLGYSPSRVAAASYAYPAAVPYKSACVPDDVELPETVTEGRVGANRYLVVTPTNYTDTFAHPLLVVFSPAGLSAAMSERFSGLTAPLTGAGFIVTYVGSRRLSLDVLESFGRIASQLSSRWCIDLNKVIYLGHSDGGTAALAMGFLDGIVPEPSAVVASAAGIRGEDLADYECPVGIAAQIWHGRSDKLFPIPAYGREVGDWWLQCNGLDQSASPGKITDCSRVPNSDVGQSRYCEHDGAHGDWPESGLTAMVDFIRSHGSPDTY